MSYIVFTTFRCLLLIYCSSLCRVIPNCVMKAKSERRQPFVGDQLEDCKINWKTVGMYQVCSIYFHSRRFDICPWYQCRIRTPFPTSPTPVSLLSVLQVFGYSYSVSIPFPRVSTFSPPPSPTCTNLQL